MNLNDNKILYVSLPYFFCIAAFVYNVNLFTIITIESFALGLYIYQEFKKNTTVNLMHVESLSYIL